MHGRTEESARLTARRVRFTEPASVSQKSYEKLLQALLHERDAISSAYNSLLALVRQDPGTNGEKAHAAAVVCGLAGLLRYMLERLHHHTAEAAVGFAQESGAFASPQCAEAAVALREALAMGLRAQSARKSGTPHREAALEEGSEKKKITRPRRRHVFAVSSRYSGEAQREIVEVVTCRLGRTTVVLRQCDDSNEESVALQFGCHVLVAPSPPTSPPAIVYLTKERLMQYVQSTFGDEAKWNTSQPQAEHDNESDVDEELDEMLCALDFTARSSLLLTETSRLTSPMSAATILPKDSPRNPLPANPTRAPTDSRSDMSLVWSAMDENRLPYGGQRKRPREEQESQVIQYRHDSPPQLSVGLAEDAAKEVALDPAQWCFQISMSLKDSKSEILKAIRRLGGRVDNSSSYNPETTHLVVAEGLAERTEKYLSCCAALKYIVTPRYIYDSVRRGRWLIGRLYEYDKNPLRHRLREPMTLPFCGWCVVLFTSAPQVDSGIVSVLQAGGCTNITSYVFDNLCSPQIDPACVDEASHLLVECRDMSPAGRFLPPPWFPPELRQPDTRFFSLELLYHLLCYSASPLFDDKGRLLEEQLVPSTCRLELP
ncbi:putative ankyrin repeat domain-containing protein 32-like isoform X1 [Trypanosoma grayi]|uniref:putative ankyrin repeat domain-containing protein 32-like isoform X1 n=1 Tax=Trypanosoma grayi TaxID=71804 RepID=UPI0004F400DD|nr:putative ankyrin repeat domain-containing protein 32-like isoform X1 [Trypanosoma grayi]KEG06642.1 putative ankyrin repeat domain-containing protein 32-like isoform X1 [Trypanosoma grayi]